MEKERHQLQRQKEALESRYAAAMRGRMLPSPQAIRLKRQIDEVKSEIRRLDAEAANRLALEKAPIDDVLEVIAIPLLADVMNDIVAGVDGLLRRNGCQETVFGDHVRTIRHAALQMVDTLDNVDDGLPHLLEVDDTLVDAIHKKLMSFIRQRLKITKK